MLVPHVPAVAPNVEARRARERLSDLGANTPLLALSANAPRITLGANAQAAGLCASDPFAGLNPRDLRILELARQKLGGHDADFGKALQALIETVVELIPAGRVYLLGAGANGPIIGSLVSGVGITPGGRGALVVRVDRDGRLMALGPLVP